MTISRVHEPMMMQRVMAVCCGCLMVLTEVSAAPAVDAVDMLFHHWSTRDGLPNNRVRGVTRTRDGFIWLATDGGLGVGALDARFAEGTGTLTVASNPSGTPFETFMGGFPASQARQPDTHGIPSA